MTRLRMVLWIVAFSQLVLGLLCVFAPSFFFTKIGLAPPPPDNGYMIGQLGARFLAYGIGLAVLARQEKPQTFWIWNMVAIQIADFLLGLYYTASGTLGLGVSAFPMFNAAAFAILLASFTPRHTNLVQP